MDSVKQFGQNLRKVRLAQGLSQEELAANCDLDRTYISGIERGVRNPSLRNIIRLSEALAVSPQEFFKDDSE